jgi:hypothetical protein
LAWTQSDINTLKQAIVDRKGARSITFSDQSVTFDSIDDMLTLLAVMQADVAVTAGRTRTRLAATSKGV